MRKSWHECTAIKDDYVDEVVLFYEGSHFVALCDDAGILAESCNLILTGRDFPEVGRVKLCGFPEKELGKRVAELQAEGWGVYVEGEVGAR